MLSTLDSRAKGLGRHCRGEVSGVMARPNGMTKLGLASQASNRPMAWSVAWPSPHQRRRAGRAGHPSFQQRRRATAATARLAQYRLQGNRRWRMVPCTPVRTAAGVLRAGSVGSADQRQQG